MGDHYDGQSKTRMMMKMRRRRVTWRSSSRMLVRPPCWAVRRVRIQECIVQGTPKFRRSSVISMFPFSVLWYIASCSFFTLLLVNLAEEEEEEVEEEVEKEEDEEEEEEEEEPAVEVALVGGGAPALGPLLARHPFGEDLLQGEHLRRRRRRRRWKRRRRRRGGRGGGGGSPRGKAPRGRCSGW